MTQTIHAHHRLLVGAPVLWDRCSYRRHHDLVVATNPPSDDYQED